MPDPSEIAKRIEDDFNMVAKARRDAEEKEAKEMEEKTKADAESAGATLDKILECLDGFTSKLDSLNSRMDAYESKKDGAEAASVMTHKKKDADKMEDPGDPKELKADSFGDSDAVRNALSGIQCDAERASSHGENQRGRLGPTNTLKNICAGLQCRTRDIRLHGRM